MVGFGASARRWKKDGRVAELLLALRYSIAVPTRVPSRKTRRLAVGGSFAVEYEALQKFFHCAVKVAMGSDGKVCGGIAHKRSPH